jgi:hypothetical protein
MMNRDFSYGDRGHDYVHRNFWNLH